MKEIELMRLLSEQYGDRDTGQILFKRDDGGSIKYRGVLTAPATTVSPDYQNAGIVISRSVEDAILAEACGEIGNDIKCECFSLYWISSGLADKLESSCACSEDKTDWKLLRECSLPLYDFRGKTYNEIFIDGVSHAIAIVPGISVRFTERVLYWHAYYMLMSIVRQLMEMSFAADNDRETRDDNCEKFAKALGLVRYSSFPLLVDGLSGKRFSHFWHDGLHKRERRWQWSDLVKMNGEELVAKTMGVLSGDAEYDEELIALYRCVGSMSVWLSVIRNNPQVIREILDKHEKLLDPVVEIGGGSTPKILELVEIVSRESNIDNMIGLALEDGIPIADVCR